MPVDKYALMRWDDYNHLTRKPQRRDIDKKTYVHSQEEGMKEETKKGQRENRRDNPVTEQSTSDLSGGGAETGSAPVNEVGWRLNQAKQKDKQRAGWGYYWEGLHFSK